MDRLLIDIVNLEVDKALFLSSIPEVAGISRDGDTIVFAYQDGKVEYDLRPRNTKCTYEMLEAREVSEEMFSENTNYSDFWENLVLNVKEAAKDVLAYGGFTFAGDGSLGWYGPNEWEDWTYIPSTTLRA
jgi:hypothetical protein